MTSPSEASERLKELAWLRDYKWACFIQALIERREYVRIYIEPPKERR